MFYKIPLGICLFCLFWKRINLGFYGKWQKMGQQRLTSPCSVMLLAELTLPQNNVFLFDSHPAAWRTEKCMQIIKEREWWEVNATSEKPSPYSLTDLRPGEKRGAPFVSVKLTEVQSRWTWLYLVIPKDRGKKKEEANLSPRVSKHVIISDAPN